MLSCKSTTNNLSSEELNKLANQENHYRGDFYYTEDAAVFTTPTEIYGVTLDGKALELVNKIARIKKDQYDLVEVIVKGNLNPKAEEKEGWDMILTIDEIVYVSDKASKADLKILRTE
ncbi:MAG: hypothetical protein JKZ03_07330 [Flavobacteriaceae bacterium]|nr:hypothetical protein [Flavobacteriaceae bacterium]